MGTSLGGIEEALIGEGIVEGWYRAGRERASLYRMSDSPANPSIIIRRMMKLCDICMGLEDKCMRLLFLQKSARETEKK